MEDKDNEGRTPMVKWTRQNAKRNDKHKMQDGNQNMPDKYRKANNAYSCCRKKKWVRCHKKKKK